MQTSSFHYYRSDALREIDRRATADGSPDAYGLMCRAGEAAFDLARKSWPWAKRWAVFCGPGNNGGDGFVLARLARQAGVEVRVFHLQSRGKISAAAAQALEVVRSADVDIQLLEDEQGVDAVAAALSAFAPDLLIDGLFGIGLSRAPSGAAAAAILAINHSGTPCLALDLPSGLDADRGWTPGVAVQATRTSSFIAAKFGSHTGRGRALCGECNEYDLDIPAALFDGIHAAAERFDSSRLPPLLPTRAADASKHDFGHALLIGGNHGMGGAICLATEAALRGGAGRVSTWTRAQHVGVILARRPECMALGIEAFEEADISGSVTALALGPGLGRDDWARSALDAVMADNRPLLLDADALNLLSEAGRPSWTMDRLVVLTPHEGEAARLLGCQRSEVAADRLASAQALAERCAAVVILKGAGSLVTAPARLPRLIDAGNPGMASGGMGDALTGVVCALMAQGLDAFDAASAGALIHATAGDHATREAGERGLLASDLMPWIRRLVNPSQDWTA